MAFDATDFIPAKVDPLTITDPRERLKYLAGFLRELPDERFDMRNWFAVNGETVSSHVVPKTIHTCGTTACIGGYAQALFGQNPDEDRELLDLTEDQTYKLFFGWEEENPTPRQAAQVIDHLLLTGEVDWGVAS